MEYELKLEKAYPLSAGNYTLHKAKYESPPTVEDVTESGMLSVFVACSRHCRYRNRDFASRCLNTWPYRRYIQSRQELWQDVHIRWKMSGTLSWKRISQKKEYFFITIHNVFLNAGLQKPKFGMQQNSFQQNGFREFENAQGGDQYHFDFKIVLWRKEWKQLEEALG